MSSMNSANSKAFTKAAPTAKQIAQQQDRKAAGTAKMNKAVDKIMEIRKGPAAANSRGKEEAQQFNGAIGKAMVEGADKKIGQLQKQMPKAHTGKAIGAARANSPSPATMQGKQGNAPSAALSAPAPKILSAQPAPKRLPTPSAAKGPATLTAAPKQGLKPAGPLSAPAPRTLSPQPAPQRIPVAPPKPSGSASPSRPNAAAPQRPTAGPARGLAPNTRAAKPGGNAKK